ncbi:MAG: MotA/TolQ/ExbB proton channel family protein, partial [Candidatus Latescibacterota bacterium]
MVELNSFLLEQFQKGGPVMWPLLLCSLLGLTFTLERYWVLSWVPRERRARAQAQAWVDELGRLPPSELLTAVAARRGLLATIYAAVLRKHLAFIEEGVPPTDQQAELAREADQSCREYLGQYLPLLSTIGSLSTLLGLLGTITGMIKAFNAIAKSGTGDPNTVAAGIAEALITTAAGLFIAIPVVASHRYLAVKAGRILRRLEMPVHALDRALTRS